MIEPRLGKYKRAERHQGRGPAGGAGSTFRRRVARLEVRAVCASGDRRCLRSADDAVGAPLRNPETGALIGNSPFMNGLIALIMVLFLVTGAAYGIGAGTMKSVTDIIKAIEKALSGLGGLIFLFLVISQFVAYFNYSNMGTILAVKMADALQDAEHRRLCRC